MPRANRRSDATVAGALYQLLSVEGHEHIEAAGSPARRRQQAWRTGREEQHAHERERHVNFNLQSFSDYNAVSFSEVIFKLWPSGNDFSCLRGAKKN